MRDLTGLTGQFQQDPQPTKRAVAQHNASAMRCNDVPRDRQTKTASTIRSRRTAESPEHVLASGLSDTRAIVIERDLDGTPHLPQEKLIRPPWRRAFSARLISTRRIASGRIGTIRLCSA